MKGKTTAELEAMVADEYHCQPKSMQGRLQYEDFFDLKLGNLFLDCCEALIERYQQNKTETYVNTARQVVFVLDWTLLRFFYHCDAEDLSKIKNFDALRAEDPLTESSYLNGVIDRMRQVSVNMIM